MAKLAARLKPGGYLHCATDWEPYAQQMLEVLGAEPLLANTSTDPALAGYAPKPDQWNEGGLFVFSPRQILAWTVFFENPTKFIFEE